jgi:hypothetical protein
VHGEHETSLLLEYMRKLLFERASFAISGAWKEQIDAALTDGRDRLLLPSLEREWWKEVGALFFLEGCESIQVCLHIESIFSYRGGRR